MALFPAFAETASNKVEDSSKELDWLNNKSFQTSHASSLHSRFLEEKESSVGREVSSAAEEKEEEEEAPKKKKKKSEKKRKKKKKHKKKSGRGSDSSGSDSETIYPSDLKREQEAERSQAAPLANRFSWLDDVQSPTGHPFCVDRKPDQANWTYKSLYRGDVARESAEESESNSQKAPPPSSLWMMMRGVKGGETGDRVQTSANPLGVAIASRLAAGEGTADTDTDRQSPCADDQRREFEARRSSRVAYLSAVSLHCSPVGAEHRRAATADTQPPHSLQLERLSGSAKSLGAS
ncbi:protein NRDE2 homolog isoform X2 [Lates japonicus]|uniref:Protein NRDE2 homolog isoform X2 n=1 Tax=Lates japonicus TaxID=270547 RepID=A0AAD3MM41_LATJO|nr:protein NRDE2 homolog isoform X2 [Lates japonicus]